MLDEAREGFMIKNDKVKRKRKHVNPINPYANADLLEVISESNTSEC
jgi:hypothetical protein